MMTVIMMKKNYRMKIGNKISQIRTVVVTTRTTNIKRKEKKNTITIIWKIYIIAFINVSMCKKIFTNTGSWVRFLIECRSPKHQFFILTLNFFWNIQYFLYKMLSIENASISSSKWTSFQPRMCFKNSRITILGLIHS